MQAYNVSLKRNKFLLDAIWYYAAQRWSNLTLQEKARFRVWLKRGMLASARKSLRRIKKRLRSALRSQQNAAAKGFKAAGGTLYGLLNAEKPADQKTVFIAKALQWYHRKDYSAADVAESVIELALDYYQGDVSAQSDREQLFREMVLPTLLHMPVGEKRDAILARQCQILLYDKSITQRKQLLTSALGDDVSIDCDKVFAGPAPTLRTVQGSYAAMQNALHMDGCTHAQAEAKEQVLGELLFVSMQHRKGKAMLRKTGLDPTTSLDRSARDVATVVEKSYRVAHACDHEGHSMSAMLSVAQPKPRPLASQEVVKRRMFTPQAADTHVHDAMDANRRMASDMKNQTTAVYSRHSVHASGQETSRNILVRSKNDKTSSYTANRLRNVWKKHPHHRRTAPRLFFYPDAQPQANKRSAARSARPQTALPSAWLAERAAKPLVPGLHHVATKSHARHLQADAALHVAPRSVPKQIRSPRTLFFAKYESDAGLLQAKAKQRKAETVATLRTKSFFALKADESAPFLSQKRP